MPLSKVRHLLYRKSRKEVGFADARVTNQHQLEQVIVFVVGQHGVVNENLRWEREKETKAEAGLGA